VRSLASSRIHEVVDDQHTIPQLTALENRLKTATEVDRYLKPSLAIYRHLTDSRWDVNTLGPDGQNALFSTVMFRNLESARFLLQHGSKVTNQTLDFAARSEDIGILRLVVESSQVKLTGESGAALLREAARSRKTDLVQFLIDSRAEVNSHGPGETPLMSAVDTGSRENAKLLLSKGADANARDNNGRVALWYAAISENTGLIALLAEHAADVNARDNDGRTPLMHAADFCFTWDIRVLLDAGADPTVQDKRRRTALQPQLVSVGDPKCITAHKMIEEAVRSRPTARK
jgi:ankyrin repeat protein